MELPNQVFYENYIHSCNKCRSCIYTNDRRLLPVCPSFLQNDYFSFCGGGKAHITQSLLADNIKNFIEISEYFYKCSLCNACKTICPVGIEHHLVIKDVREFLFNNFKPIKKQVGEITNSIKTYSNPWKLQKEKKQDWLFDFGIKNLNKQKAEALYFVGCSSSYKNPSQILNNNNQHASALPTFASSRLHATSPSFSNQSSDAEDVIKILKAADVDFGILGNTELCCGLPAVELGDTKTFHQLAAKNISKFNRLGVEKIIVSDPHCFACFLNDYPEEGEIEPQIVHITQYILELIQKGKLNLSKNVTIDTKVAAFHDPCRLGRYTNIFEEPRNILKHILNSLNELPRNRKFSFCCGNGTGIKQLYPDLLEFASIERLEEAKKAGIEMIITACPQCKNSFDKFKSKSNITSNIEILSLLHLVSSSLYGLH